MFNDERNLETHSQKQNTFEKSYIKGRGCCDNKILGRRRRNFEIQLERWIQVVRDGGRQATAGWGLVNKEREAATPQFKLDLLPLFSTDSRSSSSAPSLCLSKEQSWLRSFHYCATISIKNEAMSDAAFLLCFPELR